MIRAQDAPLGVRVLQQGLGSLRGAIGTPDQVRDLCRRYEAAGVDQVIFVLQAGRNRHEHICESLELFGAEVLPEFAAAADAADARPRRRARGRDGGRAARGAARRSVAERGLHDRADRLRAARGRAIRGRAPRPAAARGSPRCGAGEGHAASRPSWRSSAARATRGSTDRRVEPRAEVIFAAMAQAYEPEHADGFTGRLQYDLRRGDGRVVQWTVTVGPQRARSGPDRPRRPP